MQKMLPWAQDNLCVKHFFTHPHTPCCFTITFHPPLFDASDFTQTGLFLFTGEGNLSTLSIHQERSSSATQGISIFASKFPFSAMRAQSLTDSRHLKKRGAIQNLGWAATSWPITSVNCLILHQCFLNKDKQQASLILSALAEVRDKHVVRIKLKT